MYTANTMSSAFEALGMSLPVLEHDGQPARGNGLGRAEAAHLLVEAVKKDLKPRDIVTKKSIENAVAVIMATGGSTNAVLHFLAIAHAAGVEWTIDDFERMRKKVPVLCDLKPSGRFLAVDLHKAGGIPQVMKVLLKAGLLHGDCITITGKTVAENLAERARRAARRSGSDPQHRQPDVRARPPRDPEGQPVARGLRREDHRAEEPEDHGPGPRVRRRAVGARRDHGAQDRRRRRDGAALPRPEGGTRHAGDACPNGCADRARTRANRSDSSPTGASRVVPGGMVVGHVAPEAYAGGNIALVQEGDPITIDAHTLSLNLDVDDAELARRRAAWKAPAPRYTRGVLRSFAKNASSASTGAVLDRFE
jgi:dihydroxy-acid dehydratase